MKFIQEINKKMGKYKQNRKHGKGITLPQSIKKNDRLATLLIVIVSAIVFVTVVVLGRVKLDIDLGFDKHIFARINAMINTFVTLLLLGGLWAAKDKQIGRAHV